MATTYANRRRSSNRLLIPVVAAVLALGAAAAWYYLRPTPEPGPAPRPPGTISVPVAARALGKGTEMEGGRLIQPMYLRPEQVPQDAILQPNALLNRVTRVVVKPGEYFSEAKLTAAGAPAGFSGLLSPGMRMVVMNVAGMAGVVGFMREGDVVDIVADGGTTAGVARQSGNAVGGAVQPGAAVPRNGARQTASPSQAGLTLIAQGARVVIAPPNNPARRGGARNAPPPPAEVAFEVHEDDAPVLQLAMASGRRLQFVYRPFDDDRRNETVRGPIGRLPTDPRLVEIIEADDRRTVTTTLD